MKNLITKIEKAKLVGRGGACYPTALKWKNVKRTKAKKKYVVCNGSEGEPGVKKDYHILSKYADKVIDGMVLALDYLGAEKGIFYLNEEYYQEKKLILNKIIGNKPIELFKKPHKGGYIGGEETSLLNAIEHKRIEPRQRPPFPTVKGLFGEPTLINNIETFYNVSLVASDEYKNKRFVTISGDCLWSEVYEFPENYTIEKILKETDNYPKFNFFVQVGGDASGQVLNSRQLRRIVSGSGSITVYSLAKHDPLDLMRKWATFFKNESCGQCVPCREGSYRLREFLFERRQNWQMIADLLDVLEESSFCGLGCTAPVAIKTFIKNVLVGIPNNIIKFKNLDKKKICECFK